MAKLIIALTLILLMWTKWWAPASASKWRMGFNSAFKGLSSCAKAIKKTTVLSFSVIEAPPPGLFSQ